MPTNTLDMRGRACPDPVIETQKALADGSITTLVVLVDHEGSAENVARAAGQLGCSVSLEQEQGYLRLVLTRQASVVPVLPVGIEAVIAPGSGGFDLVVLMASSTLGEGSQDLGRLLMVAFLKTLGKVTPRPRTLVFLNSGVRLTTTGSEVIEALTALEEQGARIWSCGTCLDYYGLSDKLAVGTVSNMFDIASALVAADRVIRP